MWLYFMWLYLFQNEHIKSDQQLYEVSSAMTDWSHLHNWWDQGTNKLEILSKSPAVFEDKEFDPCAIFDCEIG